MSKIKYLEAKRDYNKLREQVSEKTREIHNLLEKGEITEEEWAIKTTDIEFEMGLDDALQRLIEAERRFINAGRKLLENDLPEIAKEIEKIWDCKFSTIREKVVNILLKFNP